MLCIVLKLECSSEIDAHACRKTDLFWKYFQLCDQCRSKNYNNSLNTFTPISQLPRDLNSTRWNLYSIFVSKIRVHHMIFLCSYHLISDGLRIQVLWSDPV